jgi:hypothetical protein
MVVLLVFEVAPFTTEAASFNVVYTGGVRTIEPNDYLLVKGVKALDDAGLSCNVTVIYGPNVDLLVMDKVNFENYKQGVSFSYLQMSHLNASTAFLASALGELTVGTEYYVVIDNSDKPLGGASPGGIGKVQVVYEFGAGNVQIVDSGFGILIQIMVIAIVAVAIVVVLILFTVMRNKEKPHQIAPYQPFVESKVCPRCGTHVSVEHQFCPNCGNGLR